jgi:hypothetical protein
MLLKKISLAIAFITSLSTCFGQSKTELQEFIINDLKKYAGTYLNTWDGKIEQKQTNYIFSIQNCDLIITSKFSDDGNNWGDSKIVIPIADINDVILIPKEVRGTIAMSTRLQIKTSGHTMKRYWNGKLIDMDNSQIIGLDSWTSDLGDKYKSVFKEFSKFCN